MTRIAHLEITSCYECPLLETIDGYADHQYCCPILDRYSNSIYDAYQESAAERKLMDWFESCPKWKME